MKEEKKQKKVALTVALMMGATLISKVLGLLRTVLMANEYGTGAQAQAFSEACHIPLTLFDLAFGAAVLGCFIPVYNSVSDEKEKDGFALNFFNFLLLLSSALALLGIIFSPSIINLMAPGLSGEVKLIAARLLRIMFPMAVFTAATYTLVGIMQSKGKYLLPAAVSAISNGIVVIYLLFFDRFLGDNGIYGLAVVYLGAWLVQSLTLAIPLARTGFRFRPYIDLKSVQLRKALKMTPPIMFGSWLTPLSVNIGLYFSTLIACEGANTIFDYSYTIFALICGILTYSICNYAFPLLSKSDGEKWNGIVRDGITSSLALILPFAGAVALLAGEGVAVVLMRGEFSASSAALTAGSIRFMLFGMPSFALIEVLNRVFYSKSMTFPPMISALCGIGANIISTFVFVNYTSLGTNAPALGYAVGLIACSVSLIIFALCRFKGIFDKKTVGKILLILLASAVAFGVMAAVKHFMPSNPYESSLIKNIITALAVFCPGAIIYLGEIKLFHII